MSVARPSCYNTGCKKQSKFEACPKCKAAYCSINCKRLHMEAHAVMCGHVERALASVAQRQKEAKEAKQASGEVKEPGAKKKKKKKKKAKDGQGGDVEGASSVIAEGGGSEGSSGGGGSTANPDSDDEE